MTKQFDAQKLSKHTRGLFKAVDESNEPVEIMLNGEVVCHAIPEEQYRPDEYRAARTVEILASALRHNVAFWVIRAQLGHPVVVERGNDQIVLVDAPSLTNPETREAIRNSRFQALGARLVPEIRSAVTRIEEKVNAIHQLELVQVRQASGGHTTTGAGPARSVARRHGAKLSNRPMDPVAVVLKEPVGKPGAPEANAPKPPPISLSKI